MLIERDPNGASEARYDLIVIGAGIYGCMLTLEAARHGLKPLLLERDDFGQHTSWNSLRILHGGLRYLQTLNYSRFRESVAERTWFLANFPDLVRPIPFLMPLYGRGLRRPICLSLALAANDLLSRTRNHGLRPESAIPAGFMLDPHQVLERFPGAETEGLEGGALWYDALMVQPQRIIMEALRWAVARGASVLNYVGAERLDVSGNEVRGVQGVDGLTGRRLAFKAPVVVNCAGPWLREFARLSDRDLPRLFQRSLALNVFLEGEPEFDVGLALSPRNEGGRTYFLYPWKSGVFAGTFHAPFRRGEPGDGSREEIVDSFLDDLRKAAPSLDVRAERVRRVFWGQLPVRRKGTVELRARELVHDHGSRGGPAGLFSVSGVKFTVARRVAARALRLLHRRGLAPGLRATDDGPPPPLLPLPPDRDLESEHSAAQLSSFVKRVLEEESVQSREDLILRRSDLGTLPMEGRLLESVDRLTRDLSPRVRFRAPDEIAAGDVDAPSEQWE